MCTCLTFSFNWLPWRPCDKPNIGKRQANSTGAKKSCWERDEFHMFIHNVTIYLISPDQQPSSL